MWNYWSSARPPVHLAENHFVAAEARRNMRPQISPLLVLRDDTADGSSWEGKRRSIWLSVVGISERAIMSILSDVACG